MRQAHDFYPTPKADDALRAPGSLRLLLVAPSLDAGLGEAARRLDRIGARWWSMRGKRVAGGWAICVGYEVKP